VEPFLGVSLIFLIAAFEMKKTDFDSTIPNNDPTEIVDNVVVKGFRDWMKPTKVAMYLVATLGIVLLLYAGYHLIMSF
jgi:hypothetical protein